MRTLFQAIASFAVVGLGLLLAACDKAPTAPRAVPTPASVSPVTIRQLHITAPPSLEPGASTQLKLTLKSNDTVEDVTAQAVWTSSDTRVVRLARPVS